jgi:glycosyltransferase involved in cell wall biosynthesis
MTDVPPRVSVVMTCYNGGAHLKPAVESVLTQTLTNFEFIIVDDGSNDGSEDYLGSLNDPRIVLVRNPRNRGQTASLNIGLAQARGVYVARFDSDDICLPERLACQVRAMDEHPAVDIVGSQALLIDEEGRDFDRTRLPLSSDAVWAYSLLQSPFVHPAVMLRGDMLRRDGITYDERYINQDFELWSRLLVTHRGINLADPLIRYRVHGASMTIRHHEENLRATLEIIERRLEAEGLTGALARDDIDTLLRYFFADRRLADANGIDRVMLADRFWRFCHMISESRYIDRQFMDLAVYRIVQSGLWPNGLSGLYDRLKLLLAIFRFAPMSLSRIVAELPGFLIRSR